jgi:hypothetical protein
MRLIATNPMGMTTRNPFLFLLIAFYSSWGVAQPVAVDVIVLGGGASGTMAAIQAARMGAKVAVIEETPWLGGMLTAAGVSAIDGNHNMPSGLWGEFREKLYAHYGGPKAVETGWVSNTLFEPHVGNRILQEMAHHPNLLLRLSSRYTRVERQAGVWHVTVVSGKKREEFRASVLIDATELGDVAASLGVEYRMGMDAREEVSEAFAPEEANDIVQDLTYVAILKDYGPGAKMIIKRPPGYNREEFLCACEGLKSPTSGEPSASCLQMMQYGKLPNAKYMLNWPRCGNDIYLQLIHKTPAQREEALKEAKWHTLRFVYFIQTELGFSHLGLADDEFPTRDKLPFIPYHRESRRIDGHAFLTVNHLAAPFEQREAYYRTGVAVGDYPIDHHHEKNPEAPKIEFIEIKVPSYNVPLGVMIPQKVEGLIVAEKSISVSNIVNGATRLQPVVMGIGQAAGALAALAAREGKSPEAVPVREVQQALLDAGAYLMPYRDVKLDHPLFQPIQRMGATGIFRGLGIPYKWANQTWFYPERPISEYELVQGLRTYYPALALWPASGESLGFAYFELLVKALRPSLSTREIQLAWEEYVGAITAYANRGQAAALVDKLLNPFEMPVDFKGRLISNSSQKP